MRLIAIDPGESCGVAVFDLDTNRLTTYTFQIADMWGVSNILDFIGWTDNGENTPTYFNMSDYFIIEDFRLLKGIRLTGDRLITARLCGALEWILRPTRTTWQQPSNQWGFTPRMIRIFRENYTRPVGKHLRLPKITRHEVSAIKHLMYYMRENGYKQMQDVMRYTVEAG